MKYLLILTVLLSSCFSNIMDDEYQYIQPEIRVYVESFVNEAKIRGQTIDVSSIKIAFGKIEGNAHGVTYYTHDQIQIDSSKSEWKNIPECLIFHELGHLYLHRDHDDSLLKNGNPKSIMGGEQTPVYESDRMMFKREYYLDELFNPSTKSPEWAKD